MVVMYSPNLSNVPVPTDLSLKESTKNEQLLFTKWRMTQYSSLNNGVHITQILEVKETQSIVVLYSPDQSNVPVQANLSLKESAEIEQLIVTKRRIAQHSSLNNGGHTTF